MRFYWYFLLPWMVGWTPCSRGVGFQVVDAATGAPVPCATLTTMNSVVYTSDNQGYIAAFEPGLAGQRVWLTAAAEGYHHAADGFGFEGEAVAFDDGSYYKILMDATGSPAPCNANDAQHRLIDQGAPDPGDLVEIDVTDDLTGRGVPLVFVNDGTTTWITDSGGRIAWYDIDRMGANVPLSVTGDGYDSTAATLPALPGNVVTIPLHRTQIAERLYRVTGEGIYHDSAILGYPTEVPGLSAGVMGQDSVENIVWNGKRMWLWGDTNRPSYPLGNFYTTVASSPLTDDPAVAIHLDYPTDADGFVKHSVSFTSGGPVWMGGWVEAQDNGGLYARWDQVDSSWASVAAGMAKWNDTSQQFDLTCSFHLNSLVNEPGGHELAWGAYTYAYNGVRRKATSAGICDEAAFESYTPMVNGTNTGDYAWRAGQPLPADTDVPAAQFLWGGIVEPDTGETVTRHNGSVAWNEHLQRFVSVFSQSWGSSFLGEVWFATADTPVGPWFAARKIITHADYTFYNPEIDMGMESGSSLYLEGTYSQTFSGAAHPTPRYDYNEVMYRIDLDDPRLTLPVAFYGDAVPAGAAAVSDAEEPNFFAWNSGTADATQLYYTDATCAGGILASTGLDPAFSVIDPDTVPPPGAAALQMWSRGSEHRYRADDSLAAEAYVVTGDSLGWVWRNPYDLKFPIGDFHPPRVAQAGPDRCGTSDAPVTLDGSASTSPDGIVRWEWSWEGGSTSGETAQVHFDVGVWPVTLVVTDATGATREDHLLVHIDPPGGTAQTADSGETVDDSPGSDPKSGRCGCATGRSSVWMGVLAGLMLRRRGAAARKMIIE